MKMFCIRFLHGIAKSSLGAVLLLRCLRGGFESVLPMEMDSTAKHLDICSRGLHWGFGFCGPCPSTDTCDCVGIGIVVTGTNYSI